MSKPATGEWTVGTTVSGGDKYPAIMCKGKVVWFTCLSSDRNELRKLCRAHKAALAAERKEKERWQDEYAQKVSEHENTKGICDILNEQLSAEREAGQELMKMHREAVEKCNEARQQLAAERKKP